MFNYEVIQSLNDLELSLYRYIMKNSHKVIYMRIREKLDDVCDLIKESTNLVFLGAGSSGVLCKYAARYFSSLGKFAIYIDDPYFPTHYKAYENCVIIAISISGETVAVIEHISNLKREKCKIVSITNSENCTISKISDLNISYYIQQEKLGRNDITTQIPVIYTIETLGKKLHNKYMMK